MTIKKAATTASKAKVETKAPKTDKKSPEKAFSNTSFGVQPYLLQDSEEYMNASQNEHFKGLLNAWRATLATKIDTAVLHLKDEPKHFADLNDRATQEEEFNLELRARDREADLVVKIDEALKRLNDGDYGYCEECGVEIGLRRLEARPTATLCIDCKTLAEMRERQAGGI
ncbi:MAG: RNA polymerase-binding protein DksA [Gammaproteobacteria bacterium]|nr:RNA polymerase-binding protein DksA [Gammaproteobacteria bacterium]